MLSESIRILPIRILPIRILPIRILPIRILPIRILPIRILPIRILPIRILPIRILPIRILPIRILPIRILPIRILPIRILPIRILPIRILPLVLTALAAVPVQAQAPPPFSRLAIEVGGAAQVGEAFEGAWTLPAGFMGSVAMPFYLGQVRAGVLSLSYESTAEGLTDFRGRHVFLEWTLPVEVMPRLRLEGGGCLGVFQMHFDEGTGQQQNEQEVAAFATVGASYEWRRWGIHARAAYGTVMLVEPEQQAFVSLGLSHSLAVPRWIQEVLR